MSEEMKTKGVPARVTEKYDQVHFVSTVDGEILKLSCIVHRRALQDAVGPSKPAASTHPH